MKKLTIKLALTLTKCKRCKRFVADGGRGVGGVQCMESGMIRLVMSYKWGTNPL